MKISETEEWQSDGKEGNRREELPRAFLLQRASASSFPAMSVATTSPAAIALPCVPSSLWPSSPPSLEAMSERVRELNTDELGSQRRWESVRRRQSRNWEASAYVCAVLGVVGIAALIVFILLDASLNHLGLRVAVAAMLGGPLVVNLVLLCAFLEGKSNRVDQDARAMALCLDESDELQEAMEELQSIGEAAGVQVLRANYTMQEDRTIKRRRLYGSDYWMAWLLLQQAKRAPVKEE